MRRGNGTPFVAPPPIWLRDALSRGRLTSRFVILPVHGANLCIHIGSTEPVSRETRALRGLHSGPQSSMPAGQGLRHLFQLDLPRGHGDDEVVRVVIGRLEPRIVQPVEGDDGKPTEPLVAVDEGGDCGRSTPAGLRPSDQVRHRTLYRSARRAMGGTVKETHLAHGPDAQVFDEGEQIIQRQVSGHRPSRPSRSA